MIRMLAFLLLLVVLPVLAACSAGREDGGLDPVAEEYVRLALAIGRHDTHYVDAYYGPLEWRQAAEQGEPEPLAGLLRRAGDLLTRARGAPPSPRRDFLEKQLIAAEARLRLLSGETMTLTEEARLLFDIETPVHDVEEFVRARERLEDLLPGEGDLAGRVEEFRSRFVVPPDRLEGVVRACLEANRRQMIRHISPPDGETFEFSFVREKPWSAYNWYKGELHSLIEVNTDLPIELASIFRTLSHEGYPGHHTYNALLEDRLVRGRGWMEFTVYPLFSPQSLLAEGTANAGLSVIMSEDEQWKFLSESLAPLAGLENRDFHRYRAVLEALRPLRYVRGEAARMLLDHGEDEEKVVDFLVRYGLVSEERARKSIDFCRTYRSYVFNYTVGEDLVEAYLGDREDRVERFFGILQNPMTPSHLTGETRSP